MIKDRNRTPYKDHGKHCSDPDPMQPPGADQADHNRNCHVEHIKTVLRKSDTSVNTIRNRLYDSIARINNPTI